MKIVHITSAHPCFDSRIFHKECLALNQQGHTVHLVAPEAGCCLHEGVYIHGLNSKQSLSRLQRLAKIYQLASSITADIYHFHDPEFIPFALLLKIKGFKVIYDVHEDTPRESLSFNKQNLLIAWIKYLRWLALEKVAKLFFDGFVCATPFIANNFPRKKSITVRNFVAVDEFANSFVPQFIHRSNKLLYVGNIMQIRGLNEMVTAMNLIPRAYQAELKLIGNFSPISLVEKAKNLPGWTRVTSYKWLQRPELIEHFFDAKIGLVLLHPEKNFQDALPIKLFEYMAAGLPVIVSDFPLWRDIVMTAGCGFVVNPFDIDAIVRHICFFFDYPQEAERMGRAGQEAARSFYNWQSEANSLINFYRRFE